MSKLLRNTAILFLLSPTLAIGQDVVRADDAGGCPNGYFKFISNTCVKNDALDRRSTDDLVREIESLLPGAQSSSEGSRSDVNACQSKIDEVDGDFIKLRNGAVVEKTSYGYLGYTSYKDVVLFQAGSPTRLAIEGKDKIFRVDLIREPNSCRSVSTYTIEKEINNETFLINGEKFKAKIYCLGWYEGDEVAFLDGSPYGACASASLLNFNREDVCDVWCE